MKDLSDVLDKIPAAQLQPAPTGRGDATIAAAPAPSPLDFEEKDVEAYLAHLMSQSQAHRNIRQPLDPQMLFRFCCVGLAGGCLLVAGLIAWLYRPVNALAQAQVTQDLGQAMIAMSHEVAAAKPNNTRCPLIGTCRVEAKPRSTPMPALPTQSIPVQTVPDDMGIPVPIGTTIQGPSTGDIQKARQLIHQWSIAGANSITVRDHIFQIQNGQVHHPSFPHPAAFESAYANYYGVSQ